MGNIFKNPVMIAGIVILLIITVTIIHFIIQRSDKMDTSKSERIVNAFNSNADKMKRKILNYSCRFNSSKEKLFSILCPAREADWIPGWTADIIYSESGYAEDMCVFTTDKTNPVGPGVWTFTGYKKNEYVQFVKYNKNTVLYCIITIIDNKDGTVSAEWNTSITAVTGEANKMLEMMDTDTEVSNLKNSIQNMIQYYLENGQSIDTNHSSHFLNH